MKVKAIAKTVGVSMIKARIVADTVRGMNAQDAVGILTYISKGSALPVRKVIQSAMANAKNNYNLDEKNLVISEIRVDKGPIAKINARRFVTLGKGGSASFYRKYCHITVILDDRESEEIVSKAKVKSKLEVVEVESKPAKVTVKKARTVKKESI